MDARMASTFGGVRAVLAALLLHKHLRPCPRLGSELLSENRRLKLESLASVQMPNNRATTVLLNCKRDYFAWTLGMDGSELIILTGSTLGKSGFLSVPRCMSTLPLKCAPSAMEIRGALMSPVTEPEDLISRISLAVMFPTTLPMIVTFLALISALIFPLGPMTRLWSLSSIFPSTRPSIVRSSSPVNSPLMNTDFPMLMTSSLDGLGLGSNRDSIGFFSSNAVIGTSSFRGA